MIWKDNFKVLDVSSWNILKTKLEEDGADPWGRTGYFYESVNTFPEHIFNKLDFTEKKIINK